MVPAWIDRLGERTAVALAMLLLAVVALRFDYLAAPGPHWDESQYLEAGALHAAGGSAYSQRWFNYPPPLVLMLAAAERGGWTRELVLAWRWANLAAVAVLAWIAAGRWGRGGLRRLAVALVVASVPIVGHALEWGNLSPLIAAAAIAAFATEWRRPWLSALTLGASIALKPVALGGAAFLVGHRLAVGPRDSPRVALLWPLFAVALLVPGSAMLPEMLERMSRSYFDPHHLSLRRFLVGLGWDLPATWIAAVVVAGAMILARRRVLAPDEMVVVAPVVALLALPVVWAHTFVLTLPLQVAAAARLRDRLRLSDGSRAGRLVGAELAAVGAPIVAIQAAASPVFLNGWSPSAQVLVCLLPALAPLALLAYLVATGGATPSSAAPA